MCLVFYLFSFIRNAIYISKQNRFFFILHLNWSHLIKWWVDSWAEWRVSQVKMRVHSKNLWSRFHEWIFLIGCCSISIPNHYIFFSFYSWHARVKFFFNLSFSLHCECNSKLASMSVCIIYCEWFIVANINEINANCRESNNRKLVAI